MITYDFTMLIICLGTGILGALCAVVGSWLFLQKKSLFGDTIAHATLPGITGIFMITHCKEQPILLLGGFFSASVFVYCIQHIITASTLKKDTILGVVLATSFGMGSVLLSKIQTMQSSHQAGLTKYLLGNPATMLLEDLALIIIAAIVVLLVTIYFIKPYSIMLFDPVYAKTTGIALDTISTIMLAATTITIIFGLQAVGIILMSALLINPPAAAYQWTKRFTPMMILSACFGAFATIVGTIISCSKMHLPTGPVIVMIATTITAISVLFCPEGLIMSWYRQRKQVESLSHLSLLPYFLLFNEGKQDPFYPHDIAALIQLGKPFSKDSLQFLQQHGFIQSPKPQFWCLTEKGFNFVMQQDNSAGKSV